MTDNTCFSSWVECVLQTDDGKLAYLEEDLTMKVFDVQQVENRNKIQVYRKCGDDKSVQMAFQIQMSNEYFLLTVKEGCLKAQPVTPCQSIKDKEFLFKWGREFGEAKSLVWMARSEYLICNNRVIRSGKNSMPTLFKMIEL